MSRGFDGFEIDDFRDSGFDSGRDVGRGSSSNWNAQTRLYYIHREEDRADRLEREGRQRSREERLPLAREERVQAILTQRGRARYTDRDKDYSLRDSEIYTLSEVGKFRVAAAKDLAELAYNGDHARMGSDVESLTRQGLVRVTSISDTEHNPMQVVTLTKEGQQFLSHGKILRPDQVTYYGLKKPKEAIHDAELYRLYHKVADEIEGRGGRVLRVKLDYEIKRELYARVARFSDDRGQVEEDLKEKIAESSITSKSCPVRFQFLICELNMCARTRTKSSGAIWNSPRTITARVGWHRRRAPVSKSTRDAVIRIDCAVFETTGS